MTTKTNAYKKVPVKFSNAWERILPISLFGCNRLVYFGKIFIIFDGVLPKLVIFHQSFVTFYTIEFNTENFLNVWNNSIPKRISE